jgi:hypothetical protein
MPRMGALITKSSGESAIDASVAFMAYFFLVYSRVRYTVSVNKQF